MLLDFAARGPKQELQLNGCFYRSCTHCVNLATWTSTFYINCPINAWGQGKDSRQAGTRIFLHGLPIKTLCIDFAGMCLDKDPEITTQRHMVLARNPGVQCWQRVCPQIANAPLKWDKQAVAACTLPVSRTFPRHSVSIMILLKGRECKERRFLEETEENISGLIGPLFQSPSSHIWLTLLLLTEMCIRINTAKKMHSPSVELANQHLQSIPEFSNVLHCSTSMWCMSTAKKQRDTLIMGL